MKRNRVNRGTWKYLIALVLMAVFTVSAFFSGIEKNAEYEEYTDRRKNAVTVVATVVDSYLQFREEVKWNIGAGDDVDKEVIKHPYRIHRLSYTYNGKDYICGYGNSSSSSTFEMPKGTKIELLIDPDDPEAVFDEYYSPKKSSFFGAWICVSLFLLILLAWLIKEFRYRKMMAK